MHDQHIRACIQHQCVLITHTIARNRRIYVNKTSRPTEGIDYERLAAELLRALRGKRSRPGFSRHLGFRSNVVQRWETRECWPTAARFFEICARLRMDVKASVAEFLRQEPAWLRGADFGSASGVAALLRELRGRARLADIARGAGYNRYSVARWFNGAAVPKLPEFLRVLDVASRRALDFVASFVDPASLASVAKRWKRLALSRELAYAHPLSHAVLRALELDPGRAGSSRDEPYLSRKLGIDVEQVKRALELLAGAGQVRRTAGGWITRRAGVVDTGADPKRSRALKLSWTTAAVERLREGKPGYCGYGLFAVSKSDLKRILEIQLAYIREIQMVIAASTPAECVGLYCAQLLDLSVAEDNALRLDV
jgi:hypothetical protein